MTRTGWVGLVSAVGYGLGALVTAAIGVVGWIGCFAPTPGVVCLTIDANRVIAAFVPFVLAGALFAGGIAMGRMACVAEPVHRDGLEESPWRGP